MPTLHRGSTKRVDPIIATSCSRGSDSSAQLEVIARTFTWSHDSRGLYDYEAKSVYKRNYRAKIFKIKVKEIVTTPEEARERENEAERSGRDFSEDRASALTVSTEFKDVDDDSEEALPLSEKVCRICYEAGEKENPLVAPCSGWTDDCVCGKTLVEALEVDDRADPSRTATFGAVSIQQQSSAEVPRKGLHIMSLGGNPRSVIRVGRGHDADSWRRRSTGKSLLYVVIIAGNFVGERWAYGRNKRAFEGGKNGRRGELNLGRGMGRQAAPLLVWGEEYACG
ncbi:hypothetical protein Pmar_PMAR000651 [Perkinsus marinus ATCC 50983]|uniref:Uncharacterized protein n=1 Tax=Perkinsus marinus (strain ATCC 50983 / TXsc) TaxID=423536 RepID=C5KRE5_PERM5|nr:hypothetical protein Pmar_PMAR000651 [Perkinsus marinus ATCC 50983]EER12918.1 hypothetical protein Pmar_PMAR000651 [Perkinsus marinus ATCC 50983]|eukprot:XP_002781123.1 hypothetical protein Pmar_PMAR000651 [Perkinsus marinus ATCC 50983]